MQEKKDKKDIKDVQDIDTVDREVGPDISQDPEIDKEAGETPQDGEIAELNAKIKELENEKLLIIADYRNSKERLHHRAAQEAVEQLRKVLIDVLKIIDGIDRAMGVVIDPTILEGLTCIKDNAMSSLKAYGADLIECLGKKFDPYLHEAVQQIEHDSPENTIVSVLENGYTLNKKLLRVAKVVISKAKK